MRGRPRADAPRAISISCPWIVVPDMTRHSRPLGRIEQPCDLSNRMPVSMSFKNEMRRRRRTRASSSKRGALNAKFVADFGKAARYRVGLPRINLGRVAWRTAFSRYRKSDRADLRDFAGLPAI